MAEPAHGRPRRGIAVAPTSRYGRPLRPPHLPRPPVIGMVVQARFGIDIRPDSGRTRPRSTLSSAGEFLQSRRGTCRAWFESDFFAWPTEVGRPPHAQAPSPRRTWPRFDWQKAPTTSLQPSSTKPVMVRPTNAASWANTTPPTGSPAPWSARGRDRTSGPTVGCSRPCAAAPAPSSPRPSPTSSNSSRQELRPSKPPRKSTGLVRVVHVAGIDVHLRSPSTPDARAAWVLCRPARSRTANQSTDRCRPPSPSPSTSAMLSTLRFRTGDMFARQDVTIQVEDEHNTELVFPMSLVERAETFDAAHGRRRRSHRDRQRSSPSPSMTNHIAERPGRTVDPGTNHRFSAGAPS